MVFFILTIRPDEKYPPKKRFELGKFYMSFQMHIVSFFLLLQELQKGIAKLKFPTKEDGKVAFLKALHKWPTYGSVFFEVKVCYKIYQHIISYQYFQIFINWSKLLYYIQTWLLKLQKDIIFVSSVILARGFWPKKGDIKL